MRSVVQRVIQAEVRVNSTPVGAIHHGLLVFLGVHEDDSGSDVTWMADKLVHLRIFDDEEGHMNRSLLDIDGEMLIIPQFTLFGDCRRGRRPSWSSAAPPQVAQTLYLDVVDAVSHYGVRTATGEFQAMMEVHLTNSGPVTLLLDSHKQF